MTTEYMIKFIKYIHQGYTHTQLSVFQAFQKSDPSKKDVASVFITIISSDWNKPRFTERTYVTSISEYSAVNRSILSMAINYNMEVSVCNLLYPGKNFKAKFYVHYCLLL